MKVFIYDLTNDKRVNVTEIVADTMGVDVIPVDSAEAIEIGAEFARDVFGHNNVDCGSN